MCSARAAVTWSGRQSLLAALQEPGAAPRHGALRQQRARGCSALACQGQQGRVRMLRAPCYSARAAVTWFGRQSLLAALQEPGAAAAPRGLTTPLPKQPQLAVTGFCLDLTRLGAPKSARTQYLSFLPSIRQKSAHGCSMFACWGQQGRVRVRSARAAATRSRCGRQQTLAALQGPGAAGPTRAAQHAAALPGARDRGPSRRGDPGSRAQLRPRSARDGALHGCPHGGGGARGGARLRRSSASGKTARRRRWPTMRRHSGSCTAPRRRCSSASSSAALAPSTSATRPRTTWRGGGAGFLRSYHVRLRA
jgi:hypothetical protein